MTTIDELLVLEQQDTTKWRRNSSLSRQEIRWNENNKCTCFTIIFTRYWRLTRITRMTLSVVVAADTRGTLSYSALQWIAAAFHNLMGKFWSAAALQLSASKFRCKRARHSETASARNFRQLNMQSCQLHCLLIPLLRLTTETSTFSLTNWTYLQNLFTDKSVQRCRALSIMQRLRTALHYSAE